MFEFKTKTELFAGKKLTQKQWKVIKLLLYGDRYLNELKSKVNTNNTGIWKIVDCLNSCGIVQWYGSNGTYVIQLTDKFRLTINTDTSMFK